jgi:hypothetical protein
LADTYTEEIKYGANDEPEMDVSYRRYQPQWAANLGVRLHEYTPAGMDVGPVFTS